MLESIFKGVISFDGKKCTFADALQKIGAPKVLIEPGRSIIGDAGVTLARVNNIKEICYGHKLVSLEMGVVNYAGSVIHRLLNRWEIVNDFEQRDNQTFDAFVCGNLCYNGDIIARYKASFQREPRRGDIVLIQDTGGTESHFFASNANSFPRPQRLLVDESGKVHTIKKRDTYADIFSLK